MLTVPDERARGAEDRRRQSVDADQRLVGGDRPAPARTRSSSRRRTAGLTMVLGSAVRGASGTTRRRLSSPKASATFPCAEP